ncbi:MAG: Zn-dependent protease with chaperone function [Pseudorhodobacter sp.]|jgi:Zn-dependent protease with chaperone function
MIRKPSLSEQKQAAQARLVAIVLVATMALWLGAQWLGGALGLPARFVFLFDLAALAGFCFALLVTFRIWRQRKADADGN